MFGLAAIASALWFFRDTLAVASRKGSNNTETSVSTVLEESSLPDQRACARILLVAEALSAYCYFDGASYIDGELNAHPGYPAAFRDFHEAKRQASSAAGSAKELDLALLANEEREARWELERFGKSMKLALALARRAHEGVGLPIRVPSSEEIRQKRTDASRLLQKFESSPAPERASFRTSYMQECRECIECLDALGAEPDPLLKAALWRKACGNEIRARSGDEFETGRGNQR